jgi:hypothetical protein
VKHINGLRLTMMLQDMARVWSQRLIVAVEPERTRHRLQASSANRMEIV